VGCSGFQVYGLELKTSVRGLGVRVESSRCREFCLLIIHAEVLGRKMGLITRLGHIEFGLRVSIREIHEFTPPPNCPEPQTWVGTSSSLKRSTPEERYYARVKEGVDVPLNVGQLLGNSNGLEVPPNWIFCTISFRWTNHFLHYGVAFLPHLCW